jgi:hypothetical protein
MGLINIPRLPASASGCWVPETVVALLLDAGYGTLFTIGDVQLPSRIGGALSVGQYTRSIGMNAPAGAGSQFDISIFLLPTRGGGPEAGWRWASSRGWSRRLFDGPGGIDENHRRLARQFVCVQDVGERARLQTHQGGRCSAAPQAPRTPG